MYIYTLYTASCINDPICISYFATYLLVAPAFFTSLNLQTIVTCKLNPLRVCQPVITRTFSAFVRYVYKIM